MNSNSKTIRNITLSGLFIALGVILPMITAEIPAIMKILSPMHIPAYLAGFFVGPLWGAVSAFLMPIVRFIIFGKPILFPTGFFMCIELSVYALACGLLYGKFKNQILNVYLALGSAMILGRIAAGVAKALILSTSANPITMSIFVTEYFVNSAPGILIHLILIPVLVLTLDKRK